jgi:hypothetical protein
VASVRERDVSRTREELGLNVSTNTPISEMGHMQLRRSFLMSIQAIRLRYQELMERPIHSMSDEEVNRAIHDLFVGEANISTMADRIEETMHDA